MGAKRRHTEGGAGAVVRKRAKAKPLASGRDEGGSAIGHNFRVRNKYRGSVLDTLYHRVSSLTPQTLDPPDFAPAVAFLESEFAAIERAVELHMFFRRAAGMATTLPPAAGDMPTASIATGANEVHHQEGTMAADGLPLHQQRTAAENRRQSV
eukprot:GHVU01167416.1.p1 GENE.GHVU01167416.1~~GHVU01167416.1.p1  ORF type:complete len:177 (-),score=14.22 GHVU01167416.1:605-1063(-)